MAAHAHQTRTWVMYKIARVPDASVSRRNWIYFKFAVEYHTFCVCSYLCMCASVALSLPLCSSPPSLSLSACDCRLRSHSKWHLAANFRDMCKLLLWQWRKTAWNSWSQTKKNSIPANVVYAHCHYVFVCSRANYRKRHKLALLFLTLRYL